MITEICYTRTYYVLVGHNIFTWESKLFLHNVIVAVSTNIDLLGFQHFSALFTVAVELVAKKSDPNSPLERVYFSYYLK